MSSLLIWFGIVVTICGANIGMALVVAAGISVIIMGLILSRPLGRNVLRYLDKKGFQ